MTLPKAASITLPSGTAHHILGLLTIAEAMLSVLRARGENGESQTQASLEEVSAHLTGGHDASHLIGQLKQAARDLESLLPSSAPGEPPQEPPWVPPLRLLAPT